MKLSKVDNPLLVELEIDRLTRCKTGKICATAQRKLIPINPNTLGMVFFIDSYLNHKKRLQYTTTYY